MINSLMNFYTKSLLSPATLTIIDADTVNQALQSGRICLLQDGIYSLNTPILADPALNIYGWYQFCMFYKRLRAGGLALEIKPYK